jgi:hypothetical protein
LLAGPAGSVELAEEQDGRDAAGLLLPQVGCDSPHSAQRKLVS